MSVMIYVWRAQAGNPGHVSMDIDGEYVSYWPGGAAGKKDFKIGETHEPAFPKSYRTDRRLEQRQHDEEVEIDGLNTTRMLERWNDFRANPVRYNMVESNCSTVVASLLEAGSGIAPGFAPQMRVDDHVEDWAMRFVFRLRYLSAHVDMWTPDGVLRYALELKRQLRSR